jgi:hypothetical protein
VISSTAGHSTVTSPADDQGLVIGLLDGSAQAIAIFEHDLISEERCGT